MTLKNKTATLIILSLIFTSILGFFAFKTFYNSRFDVIEEELALNENKHVLSLINTAYQSLNTSVADWAVWDDTYKYINEKNPEYVASNLVESAYTNLKINIIQAWDKKGSTVYYGSYDYLNSREFQNDTETKELLQEIYPLIKFENIGDSYSGFIGKNNVYYFAAQQVTMSEITDNSESNGILLFMKKIEKNDDTLLKFGSFDRDKLSLINIKEAEQSGEFQSILSTIKTQDSFADNSSPQEVIAYDMIKDINGSPVLILQRISQKVIGQESLNIFIFSYLIILVLLIIMSLIIFFNIEKNVLGMFQNIVKFIENIDNPLITKSRLDIKKGSEFAKVEETLNKLLDRVNSQNDELTKANKEFQDKNKELEQREQELALINKDLNVLNQSMMGREMKMIELKKELVDIRSGQNPEQRPEKNDATAESGT
jgi:sensor domain CHASE-containing protein